MYAAVGFLVAAQLLGVYGLITRKADLIFALVMVGLLIGAVVTGAIGAYDRLH